MHAHIYWSSRGRRDGLLGRRYPAAGPRAGRRHASFARAKAKLAPVLGSTDLAWYVIGSVLWAVGLAIVFAVLALRRYRRS